ncbi:MAG: tyrosine/phenylalanine carboxypeptidase domain-containing protein, partial [Phycisphaerales bacterium]
PPRTVFLEGWRNSRIETPRFEFEAAGDLDTATLVSFRKSLRASECDVEAKYDQLAEEALATIEFLADRSASALTELTVRAYGRPDAELVARAYAILDAPPPAPAEPATIDAESAATSLRVGLADGGYEGWQVVVDPLMNARMAVDSLRREVKVRAGAMFRPDAIARLLVHEIGVHVHRADRGDRQPIKLLGRGLPGYLSTEEGLAVWSEQQAGLLDPATLRVYAARVLAADATLQSDFVETYRLVEPHVGAEVAFEIAARSKRGLLDPSVPGGHVKDQVYLRGLIEVSQHLAIHPETHSILMSGKIGIGDLAWFESLRRRSLASILPPTFPPGPGPWNT